MRWLASPLLLCLSACGTHSGGGAPAELPRQSSLCEQYVAAWVGHFQANVARLDGAAAELRGTELEQARQALGLAGVDERSCSRPFCIIQPQAGGRLTSYCGYRVASGTSDELYRWVPWVPQSR